MSAQLVRSRGQTMLEASASGSIGTENRLRDLASRAVAIEMRQQLRELSNSYTFAYLRAGLKAGEYYVIRCAPVLFRHDLPATPVLTRILERLTDPLSRTGYAYFLVLTKDGLGFARGQVLLGNSVGNRGSYYTSFAPDSVDIANPKIKLAAVGGLVAKGVSIQDIVDEGCALSAVVKRHGFIWDRAQGDMRIIKKSGRGLMGISESRSKFPLSGYLDLWRNPDAGVEVKISKILDGEKFEMPARHTV